MTTAVPTVMKTNNPTILHEIVRLRKIPVRNSQVHHGLVNSLRRSSDQLGFSGEGQRANL